MEYLSRIRGFWHHISEPEYTLVVIEVTRGINHSRLRDDSLQPGGQNGRPRRRLERGDFCEIGFDGTQEFYGHGTLGSHRDFRLPDFSGLLCPDQAGAFRRGVAQRARHASAFGLVFAHGHQEPLVEVRADTPDAGRAGLRRPVPNA